MKTISKLAFAITSTLTINAFAINSAVTQEANLDSLCSKFPLNSRCEDYKLTKTESKIYQLDRNTFCGKFPFNSKCQQPQLQVIKLNLDRSGENDEWIRIEKQNNKIKLLHTTKVKDGLVSGALNGALGLVPIPFPLPFVEANKYDWQNHPVTKVTYQQDNCKTNNCMVTGKDTITLPPKTDIYAGLFTINYREKGLMRSLSFRIPADIEAETIDTITIEAQQ